MKIETEFTRKLCRIYDLLALPYPPRTLQNTDDPDDVEIEEVLIKIKPFNPKIKSYDIDHDSLTSHHATKQLSKFVEEAERRRRETDKPSMHEVEENYLHYKQNVVSFINDLAKGDNFHSIISNKGKHKNHKEAVLGNIVGAVKQININKETDAEKNQQLFDRFDGDDLDGKDELVQALNEVEEFNDVPHNLSSEEFVSIQGSEDNVLQRGGIVTKKLKKMVENSMDINVDPQIAKGIKNKMVIGAGISKMPQRDSKLAHKEMGKAVSVIRRKSNAQTEFVKKTAARQLAQKRSITENKEKINAVLNNVKRQVEISKKDRAIFEQSKRPQQKFNYQNREPVTIGGPAKRVIIDTPAESSKTITRDKQGFAIPQVTRKVRRDSGYPKVSSSRTPSPRDLRIKTSKDNLKKSGPAWRF